jgi:hypothetical protein
VYSKHEKAGPPRVHATRNRRNEVVKSVSLSIKYIRIVSEQMDLTRGADGFNKGFLNDAASAKAIASDSKLAIVQ